MKTVSILIFLCLSGSIFAQENPVLIEREQVLDSLLDQLRSAENNQEKDARNLLFKAELESALNEPKAMEYSFSKLETVGFIDSPDKMVRIVNWNVEQDDLSHKYYCYVLYNDKKKDEVRVTELKDMSFGMPSQPEDVLESDNWYGALYYKIIPVDKGSRTLYTVLGWDHNSTLSQLKLIDVLYFTGTSVKLGSPIFRIGKETKNRVFFEYSKKVNMYMNYETDRKRIMMDHLSPESQSLKNFRSYYVPDLSYDAFVFENNKWVLMEDVIGVNGAGDQSKTQSIQVMNERTGKLETRQVKTSWVNPEDPEAPGGGSEHVAVTPESVSKEEQKESHSTYNELDDRVNKRDKRDPNELSTVNGGKKRRFWQRKKKR